MKTKPKKKRNRAAQDVNLINLRALKKRVARLEQQVSDLLDMAQQPEPSAKDFPIGGAETEHP